MQDTFDDWRALRQVDWFNDPISRQPFRRIGLSFVPFECWWVEFLFCVNADCSITPQTPKTCLCFHDFLFIFIWNVLKIRRRKYAIDKCIAWPIICVRNIGKLLPRVKRFFFHHLYSNLWRSLKVRGFPEANLHSKLITNEDVLP